MIPLADLKAHLRIPSAETSEDAIVMELEAAAVAAVERYTGRHFGAVETVTERSYDGTGTSVIWLAEEPLAGETITVEEYDGVSWAATTDYEIDGFALYHTTGVWALGRRNVRISYSRGYAANQEPENVRQAVRLLVAEWYQNREAAEVRTMPGSVKALLPRRVPV